MDLIISLCGAVLFTALGVVLLRVAEKAAAQSEEAELTHFHMPIQGAVAAMAAVNLILALLLPLFYRQSLLVVFRTLLMCSVLWPCAWADARGFLIPNKVLLVGAVSGALLLAADILLEMDQASYLLISTVIAVGALTLVSLLCKLISPKTVGMGDVKLLAIMGLCLGTEFVWTALFFSFFFLFLVCLVLLIARRVKRSDSVPLAPFLLVGTIAAAILCGI